MYLRHRRRPIVTLLAGLTFAAATVVAVPSSPARAAVGDLRQTVDVPAAAQCSSGIGTSVAVVPGSMVGLGQTVLLVVSCLNAGSNQHQNLYFLDPSSNPATLVKTIATSNTPPEGWGSLAVRGDKGDVLGCGNATDGTHGVYRIDVNPFNGTPDGTAVFLFNAQPGFTICDGVAWDASDDTIFQSPDVSDTVYHFSAAGALLNSFAVPAGCPNSGVAVGGTSLFASCNGVLTIHQLNKATGAPILSFSSGGSRTEDLECDPLSFAASNVDVMWSKDAFDNQIFAFEIPQGTCGFAGGPLLPKPACSDTDGNGNVDNDGDALCDNWETAGIDSNGDGTVDLQLYDVNQDGAIQPGEDADPNHKDVYLEIDFMALHQPNALAVGDVIAAFANADVTNPDLIGGIRLHVQVNEQAVAHNDNLAFEGCTATAPAGTPDFDTVKSTSFGTAGERTAGINVTNAKRFAARWALYAHNLLGKGSQSGCAEVPGNDHVVSLGGWDVVAGHGVGNREQQAGTLMHEFGHNLNLQHGGPDSINCKPNYLSVMSYTRQINNNPIPNRPLDYSRSALPTLNEASLNEPAGISGPAGDQTAFGPPPVQVVPSAGPIDWNRDGDTVDPNVAADINNLGPLSGCTGFGTVHAGHDDWANVKYDFYNTIDFADGIHLSVLDLKEMTAEEARQLAAADVAVQLSARPRLGILVPHLDYTLRITNRGPAPLQAAEVRAVLPNGVTNTSGQCTNSPGLTVCTVGTLAPGAAATFHIHVPLGLLTIGTVTVTATKASSTPVDPVAANNTASASCQVITPLLAICN